MSNCAYFVSAPTVRFLQAIEKLALLPSVQRRTIAADVYTAIKPLAGSCDVDALRRAADGAQAERWRLISSGVGEPTEPRFATVTLTEQWLLAQLELLKPASPVAEVLADKRCSAIELFIRHHLAFEHGEVVPLHAQASLPPTDQSDAARSAA
jgi:hypothetical protein